MDKYIFISGKDFNEARKRIREAKGSGKTIVFTSDDELARKVLEKETIDILLINQKGRRDMVKQRGSGFNQVMAKTSKKKDIVVGINLDEILEAEQREKGKMLARVRQNIKLCSKNKLKMGFISKTGHEKDKYDLRGLGLVLGMPTWMIKNL